MCMFNSFWQLLVFCRLCWTYVHLRKCSLFIWQAMNITVNKIGFWLNINFKGHLSEWTSWCQIPPVIQDCLPEYRRLIELQSMCFYIQHGVVITQSIFCKILTIYSPCGCGDLSVRLGSRISPHRHRVVVEVHWRGAQGWRSISWVVATFNHVGGSFGVMCCMLSTFHVSSRIVANFSEPSLLFSQ